MLYFSPPGISKSIAFRNTKSLMEAINQLQPSYDRGGSEYYGILRTSQEVPYDSAIFLATSKSTTDPQLARMTALTLLKKRIRVSRRHIPDPRAFIPNRSVALFVTPSAIHPLVRRRNGCQPTVGQPNWASRASLQDRRSRDTV